MMYRSGRTLAGWAEGRYGADRHWEAPKHWGGEAPSVIPRPPSMTGADGVVARAAGCHPTLPKHDQEMQRRCVLSTLSGRLTARATHGSAPAPPAASTPAWARLAPAQAALWVARRDSPMSESSAALPACRPDRPGRRRR